MTKILRLFLLISVLWLSTASILAESFPKPSEPLREDVKHQQEQVKEEVREVKDSSFEKIRARFLEHIDKIIH